MGTYNVHAGHAPSNSGGAGGAVGILNESDEARKVKDQVTISLRNKGHTVYDCTCNQGLTQNGVLKDIVSKCNAHVVDLDISIHFNAGGGKGVEVWCYDSGTSAVASRICNAITSLGFANRGVKYSKQLYVLSTTKSPAILIECCFVDSQTDASLYDVGKMANAIVSGILGVNVAAWENYQAQQVDTSKYLQIYELNNSIAQKWMIETGKDGISRFWCKANMQYVDAVNNGYENGTPIQTYNGNNTTAQSWIIKKIEMKDKVVEDLVVYEFIPKRNGNMRLDVSGANIRNGTKVQLYKSNNSDAQRWYIRPTTDGFYNIINVGSGKCLDLPNAGK